MKSERLTRLRLGLLLLATILVVLFALLFRLIYEETSARSMPGEERQPRPVPNTDVNPLGANFFLAREVEPWKRDKTLQMAADAGIEWVKQQFPWEEIEPSRKGEFLEPTTKGSSWTKYDEIVAACEKYGLSIVARLDRPPAWTRQDNTYQERPPDDIADYGDFVYAFVKRYAGRIDYVQIWNEPNVFPEWGNQAVNPVQYVELLKVAYTRAKEANPSVRVLCAPLAITLGEPHPDEGQWHSMPDLLFLEEMYEARVKDYFDIYSANAFGMDRPPEDPADPDVLNFQRVVLHREIMERYGDEDKAVWFNEYGWNAAPESLAPELLSWSRVTEAQQAEYTLRGIQMAREEWPWAGVFMIWYFRQVGSITPSQANYYFRMVDTDFTPRLMYRAIQDAHSALEPGGLGRYEETAPEVELNGNWSSALDDRASGGGWVRAGAVGDSLAFAFQGTAVDLITTGDLKPSRLYLSLDGRPVSGLAVDADGLSYLDVQAFPLQSPVRVPILRGASTGKHTLRLTVGAVSEASGAWVVLDALEVVSEEQRQFPIWLLLGLVTGLLVDSWLLWRVLRRWRWAVRSP